MLPAQPIFDPTNKALLHTVFCGNVLLLSSIAPDRVDLHQRQFMCATPFSAIGCTMTDTVSLIGCPGVPPKVFKPVIMVVSVIMTAFLAMWTRPYKGLQNQRMGSHNALLVVLPQINVWPRIEASFANCWPFDFTVSRVADAPLVRNLIKPLVAYYRKPLFHLFNPHRYLWIMPC